MAKFCRSSLPLGPELALTRTEQDALLARLAEGSLSGATETKAKNVQQIRNVAEIIQRTRPPMGDRASSSARMDISSGVVEPRLFNSAT